MSKIKVGDKVPAITFNALKDGEWVGVSTDDIFSGKTVALFALPGAFTPTCSEKHLPGYMDNKAELEAAGVDSICCLSVNDTFVMNAWAKSQGIEDHINIIPDGNCRIFNKRRRHGCNEKQHRIRYPFLEILNVS